MPVRRIGILHPGEMGRVAAASLANGGNEIYWISEGRSTRTQERAAALKLKDAVSAERLCERCEVIVSVCPPEFAEAVSDQVLDVGFRGLYIDANAISPERVRRMERRMTKGGVTFVDGGIIGPATMTPGKVWIYLSGPAAQEAASCFAAGPLQAEVMLGEVGQASALKMCFAAFSKGTTALLAAILATADRQGVRADLERQWTRMPGSPVGFVERIQQSAPKAWRFVPEMHEIAATFEASDVTPGFHQAAAEVYARLAEFKNATPELEEILRALGAHAEQAVSPNVT